VEGIETVMGNGSESNRFSRALEAIQRIADNEGFPVAIVEGLGAIHYGYPAATQDIDLAVGQADLDRLIRCAPRYGFKIARESSSGWHTLVHGDVEINVIPQGGKANDRAPTTIPGPVAMGVASGLDYARIESWMELKISSGRQKDRAHVVEVLKLASAETIARIARHLAAVHPAYQATFSELLVQAEEEKRQEGHR